MAIKINIGGHDIPLRPSDKISFDPGDRGYFFAEAQLAKSEYCEKCLGKMKKTATRRQRAKRSSFAVYTYTCQKCGHTYEENNSRD